MLCVTKQITSVALPDSALRLPVLSAWDVSSLTDSPLTCGADAGSVLWDLQKDAAARPEELKKNQAKKKQNRLG